MCIAAFNVFAYNFPSIVIGGTSDRPFYDGPSYVPANMGCDAPMMIMERLDAASIPVGLTPRDWLQVNGIGIEREFSADFNQDGNDEALIWTNVPGMQVLFVSERDSYTVVPTGIDPYQSGAQLTTWLLPGNVGLGLAMLSENDFTLSIPPWPPTYDNVGGWGGGPVPQCQDGETITNANNLWLWRLDETKFAEVLRMTTCADTAEAALGSGGLRSITTNFNDYRYVPEEGDVLQPYALTYVWDNTEERYIVELSATPTPYATVASTATPMPQTPPQRTYHSVSRAFADEAYAVVLDMTPPILAPTIAEDPDNLLAEMYLRALSLKALGEDDRALALFVDLKTTDSEHIIGKLAALHVERMGTD
jgi:hypothetical protein